MKKQRHSLKKLSNHIKDSYHLYLHRSRLKRALSILEQEPSLKAVSILTFLGVLKELEQTPLKKQDRQFKRRYKRLTDVAKTLTAAQTCPAIACNDSLAPADVRQHPIENRQCVNLEAFHDYTPLVPRYVVGQLLYLKVEKNDPDLQLLITFPGQGQICWISVVVLGVFIDYDEVYYDFGFYNEGDAVVEYQQISIPEFLLFTEIPIEKPQRPHHLKLIS